MSSLFDRLYEASLRMESIINVAGMITADGSFSDPLEDFLDDNDEELKRCFPDMPACVLEAMDDRHERGDVFTEWALESGKLGFLVQFSTPTMEHHPKSNSWSFSWSSYYTRWVYGDTFDLAVERGLEWAEERRAAERAKAAGNKEGG